MADCNEFKGQLSLNPIRPFDDLTDDGRQPGTLKDLYGGQPGNVEKLDLLIGTLAGTLSKCRLF